MLLMLLHFNINVNIKNDHSRVSVSELNAYFSKSKVLSLNCAAHSHVLMEGSH